MIIEQIRAALLTTDPGKRLLQLHVRSRMISNDITATEHDIQLITHHVNTLPDDVDGMESMHQGLVHLEHRLRRDQEEYNRLRQDIRTKLKRRGKHNCPI